MSNECMFCEQTPCVCKAPARKPARHVVTVPVPVLLPPPLQVTSGDPLASISFTHIPHRAGLPAETLEEAEEAATIRCVEQVFGLTEEDKARWSHILNSAPTHLEKVVSWRRAQQYWSHAHAR